MKQPENNTGSNNQDTNKTKNQNETPGKESTTDKSVQKGEEEGTKLPGRDTRTPVAGEQQSNEKGKNS